MKAHSSPAYKTVLTISVGFSILFAITQVQWLLWLALCVELIGLISSYLAERIHQLWMQLSKFLSHIFPPVLLTLVFFCLLYPMALLARIFGEKDPLKLKDKQASMFKKVDKQPDRYSFHKTW